MDGWIIGYLAVLYHLKWLLNVDSCERMIRIVVLDSTGRGMFQGTVNP
jgi:hypothetical protein